MTANLTPEQLLALHSAGGLACLIDPDTHQQYVLVPKDRFDRIRPLLYDEPLTREEQRKLLEDMGRRAGWEDPEMDAYDNYDQHRPGEL